MKCVKKDIVNLGLRSKIISVSASRALRGNTVSHLIPEITTRCTISFCRIWSQHCNYSKLQEKPLGLSKPFGETGSGIFITKKVKFLENIITNFDQP
jgi:hypothetical protein